MTFDELLPLFLEGLLTEPQQEEFEQLLRSDERRIEAYLDLVEIDVLLTQELLSTPGADVVELEFPRAAPDGTGHWPAAIAFAVLSLAFIGGTVWLFARRPAAPAALPVAPVIARPELPTEPAAPVLVAVVRDVYIRGGQRDLAGPLFESSAGGNVAMGARFMTGDELSLINERGFVELQFESGARLTVQGPAKAIFESPRSINLLAGRVLGQVPPEAIGFTVRIPSGLVEDLGTEFAIEVSDVQSTVSVLHGAVVSRLTTPTGVQSQRVDRDQNVRIDPVAATLSRFDGRPARLQEIEAFHSGIAQLSGLATYLRGAMPPPQNPSPKAGSVTIGRERQRIALQRVPASQNAFHQSGKPQVAFECDLAPAVDDAAPRSEVIVDSFLLRLDPQLVSGQVKGTVTFRRPILGVLANSGNLKQTDAVFASPQVAAGWESQSPVFQKLRGGDEPADAVSLGADGHSLSFGLQSTQAFDELRVLVESDVGTAEVPPP
jgi:ferric-dicitrate binding protein FerR (iron transport regulator)